MSLSSVAADRGTFWALTALLATGLVGPPLVVGLAAAGVPVMAGTVAVMLVTVGLLVHPAVRSRLAGLRLAIGTPVTLLFILGLTVATCYNVRLSRFMIDATRSDLSVLPNRKFFREHACLSSYTEAARFAAAGLNIYEVQRYVDIPKPGEFKDRYIGPISVDIYQYPPTFLVLPYPALAAGLDFFTVRQLWFVIQSAVLFTGIVLLARWISGPAAIVALLLMPAIWLAQTTRVTLQVGNFQLTAFPLAVLAMMAFERGRNVAGGLGLGLVAASKIFPGVLGLVLIGTRQWKAVVSTIGWSVALTLLAWMLVGSKPFTDFLTFQLPRIESGEAFFWIEQPEIAPINQSVYGLVTKLRQLGVPMTSQVAGNRASSVYALFVFLLAAFAGWRLQKLGSTGIPSDRLRMRHAQVWLALLTLASLRSPFVPDAYGLVGTMWLLTLVAADRRRRGYWWAVFGAAMIAFSLVLDGGLVTPPVPAWIVLLTLAIQLAAIGVNIAAVVGVSAASGRPDPSRLPTRDVEFRVP